MDKKKIALGAGLATIIVGGIMLLQRKSSSPEGPEGLAFSLRIINAPEDTAYWVTNWSFLLVDETWWFYDEFPAQYINIVFLDSQYLCPPGDPNCLGILVWFAPEPGKSYVLNCATGEIVEDLEPPPPPPPPTPSEPSFISADYPAKMTRGIRYTTHVTLWLAEPWMGYDPMYMVYLELEGIPQYIFTGIYTRVGSYSSDAVEDILDGDGEYLLTDDYAVIGGSAAPGVYPVRCTVQARNHLGGGVTGNPVENYDLGIIGTVEVS